MMNLSTRFCFEWRFPLLFLMYMLWTTPRTCVHSFHLSSVSSLILPRPTITRTRLHDTTPTSTTTTTDSSDEEQEDVHPAVLGWPDKYQPSDNANVGPQSLHTEFTVEPAAAGMLSQLDVLNWPTWTTADKEKWAVGKQNVDKVMPYNELSYVVEGKLEIIPADSPDEPVIVQPNDFVTFPKDFCASWKVLEELTWHYYLY